MHSRIDALLRAMREGGIDAVLLTHPRDVLYYAGTARPATLLISPQQETLFIRRGTELARAEATVKQIEAGSGFQALTAALAREGLSGGRLGLALDVTSANLYLRTQQAFAAWEIVDAAPLVLGQRMIKDEQELKAIREAARVADAGHAALPKSLRPGMTELALAAEVEAAMRYAGHEGYQPLRKPEARGGGVLLASGNNLTVRGGHGLVVTGDGLSPGTPYGPSLKPIQPGDMIMLDIGSTFLGYTADESRTFVLGHATSKQEALHEIACATEDAVMAAIRPGTPVSQVYAVAVEAIARGQTPHFGPGDLALPGFVGHGVGLEIDEPPVIWDRDGTVLEIGMVLAIEIEVSAPGAGLMSKVEDTVVVTGNGPDVLTAAPRELVSIEV